jgi:hypothetical protein
VALLPGIAAVLLIHGKTTVNNKRDKGNTLAKTIYKNFRISRANHRSKIATRERGQFEVSWFAEMAGELF